MLPVVKLLLTGATGFPARSVTAPVCSVSVYLVLAARSAVCLMVSIFPLTLVVMVTEVPVLDLSSTQLLLGFFDVFVECDGDDLIACYVGCAVGWIGDGYGG